MGPAWSPAGLGFTGRHITKRLAAGGHARLSRCTGSLIIVSPCNDPRLLTLGIFILAPLACGTRAARQRSRQSVFRSDSRFP